MSKRLQDRMSEPIEPFSRCSDEKLCLMNFLRGFWEGVANDIHCANVRLAEKELNLGI